MDHENKIYVITPGLFIVEYYFLDSLELLAYYSLNTSIMPIMIMYQSNNIPQ